MLKLGNFTFKDIHVVEDVMNDNHPTIVCDFYYEDEVMLTGVIIGVKFWKNFRDAVKLAGEQSMIGKVDLELLKLLLKSNKDY
ncbi:hypothetical protein [Citrobacter sp. Igbk 16]|uniref:hypothetical protein n=1 Tax=Citrobacter sp. Igbk 16 TaxID=2963958 RepID=UPI002302A9CD|nr:hypothetical protein [Citrobacter sp. Igbk 16]MDA8516630.1 hypothetical protein [Citrobacter sp. Igbk 16]